MHYQNFIYQKENIQNQINNCINFPTDEINKITLPNKVETINYLLSIGKISSTSNYEPTKTDFLYYELEVFLSLI